MVKRVISLTLAAVMVCITLLGGVPDVDAAKKATIKTKKISIKVGEKKTIKIANKQKKPSISLQPLRKRLRRLLRKAL